MSSDTLSHEDAIGQFCGVTGADEDRAKGLLEACDWNLELAINMHVDTEDSRFTSNRTAANPVTGSSSSESSVAIAAGPSTSGVTPPIISIPESLDDDENGVGDEDDRLRTPVASKRSQACSTFNAAVKENHASSFFDPDEVRPPIPPVRQVLVQNPLGYSSDMPQVPRRYNTRTGATSDVYDAFRDFQAEAAWQEMAQQEGEASTPDASNTNKRRTLQELFRPPLEVMFRGSLDSAREFGTLHNKWLLVNVQNSREFACQMLNRDVWSSQAVQTILKESFIFWQVYHDSYEGGRFLNYYHVLEFPHVSIIDPRTGELMKLWRPLIEHNSFCDSVLEFLNEHPSPDGSSDANTMKKLRVKEEDVEKTLYDQSEEAQLEAAIKASLLETENSNSKPFVDEDSYTDAVESDNNQSEVENYEKYLGTDKEKFSELMVRYPDGAKDHFRFPSDSLMKALFLLLASRGFDTNQYNYLTNFPRRLLHELSPTATLQDAKLIRETIFIERKLKDIHLSE